MIIWLYTGSCRILGQDTFSQAVNISFDTRIEHLKVETGLVAIEAKENADLYKRI